MKNIIATALLTIVIAASSVNVAFAANGFYDIHEKKLSINSLEYQGQSYQVVLLDNGGFNFSILSA